MRGLARDGVHRSRWTEECVVGSRTDYERGVLGRQIGARDEEIDHLVYELYELSDEEILLWRESRAGFSNAGPSAALVIGGKVVCGLGPGPVLEKPALLCHCGLAGGVVSLLFGGRKRVAMVWQEVVCIVVSKLRRWQ
jgi:hypothetical protein